MTIIDFSNPQRVNREPDKKSVLLSNGTFYEQDFLIKRIELKLYIEKIDEKRGPYSLITANIETDKGSIEMIYDEGFRGENSLEKATEFVINNLGISALVQRSIISLKDKVKNSN